MAAALQKAAAAVSFSATVYYDCLNPVVTIELLFATSTESYTGKFWQQWQQVNSSLAGYNFDNNFRTHVEMVVILKKLFGEASLVVIETPCLFENILHKSENTVIINKYSCSDSWIVLLCSILWNISIFNYLLVLN